MSRHFRLRTSRIAKYSILALLVLVYFGARLPLYTLPFAFEEGAFADIFLHHPRNPNYILYGRIDGENLYGPPEHPALMYEFLSLYGRAWQLVIDFEQASVLVQTITMRAAFSLFQFIVLFMLTSLLLFARHGASSRGNMVPAVGLVALAATPLAVDGSVSLQIDGSVGVIAVGSVGVFLLVIADRHRPSPVLGVAAFLAGLVYGLGKNEWSIALVVSIGFVWGLVAVVLKPRAVDTGGDKLEAMRFVLGGVIAGNALSYFVDPFNYIHGFDVMMRIVRASGMPNAMELRGLLSSRTSYIAVFGTLLAALMACIIERLKEIRVEVLLLVALGALLLLGYLLSPWAVEPRYYVPAFVAMVSGFAIASRDAAKRIVHALLALLMLVILWHAISSFGQDAWRLSIFRNVASSDLARVNAAESVEIATSGTGCIPIMSQGEAFWLSSDFLSDSLTREDAAAIAGQHGRALCED